MAPFRREVLTDALLLMLRAAVDPVLVGDAKAPEPPADQVRPNFPYYVLDPVPGGGKTGAAFSDNPQGLATWVYQLTSVGLKVRGQAEWAQDLGHKAILSRAAGAFVNAIVLPGGAFVGMREHDSYGPTEPSGDLWLARERFRISTSS